MVGLNIEDCVILLDTSASMLRRDFEPSRLRVTVRGLLNLIQRKFEIDANDRLAIVTFGKKATKLHDFTSTASSLQASFARMEISSKSDISDGLALSMQMLASEIRKIGGKVPRILLFSDDRLGAMTDRLIKLANAAKGLGIFIDCLVAGGITAGTSRSVMKNLASITSGDFAQFKNEHAYAKAIVELASKKDLNDVPGYFASQEREMKAPLLSEIAVELRRPNIKEIQDMIVNPTKLNCNICYKSTSPTGQPPYASLRFCPSCSRPVHLACATQWARSASNAKDDVFRCPFCYFLLRGVPASLLPPVKQVMDPAGAQKQTRMSLVPSSRVPDIEGSCGQCHVIFLGEYEVYKCATCNTYYHKPCVADMFKKSGGCRACGREIQNINEILS